MDTRFTVPVFEDATQEAVFYRGAFLHHYGIVEFIISDLILRALYSDEYRHLGKLPGKWGDKLKRLGQVVDAPGPLNVYSQRCRRLVSHITIIELDRHLLTHGRMRVRDEFGTPFVHLEMYDAYSGSLKENDLPMKDVRYLAQELGSAALALSELAAEMIDCANLEAIPLEAAEVHERAVRQF